MFTAAYRRWFRMPRRYPFLLLRVETAPEHVDVDLAPDKRQVMLTQLDEMKGTTTANAHDLFSHNACAQSRSQKSWISC